MHYLAYGLRIGGTNFLANIPLIELHHIIIRGGWELADICKVFEYILQLSSTVAIAGRALAHSKTIFAGAFPPRMVPVEPDVKHFFSNFMNLLFMPNVPARFSNSSLHTLLEVISASIIMSHDEMINDCGLQNVVVKTVNAAIKQLKFPVPKFRALAKQIEVAWRKRNASAQTDGTSTDIDTVASMFDSKLMIFKAEIDASLDAVADLIVEKVTARLASRQLESTMASVVQGNDLALRNINDRPADVPSVSIATLGDRGKVEVISTLKEISLRKLVIIYYSQYMDDFSEATWHESLPASGNRTRFRAVIDYIQANMTETHKEFIATRPCISLSSTDTFISWNVELAHLAEQVELHITSILNSEAARKSRQINSPVDGLKKSVTIGTVYKAISRITIPAGADEAVAV